MNDFFSGLREVRFKEFVKQACKSIGLEWVPKVTFEDGYLLNNMSMEACIDVLNREILISRIHLNRMSIEEIKEIAVHEVTHLIEKQHNSTFHGIRLGVETATFQPPSGTVAIGGNVYRKPNKQKKEERN